jgi:hypothetical protein
MTKGLEKDEVVNVSVTGSERRHGVVAERTGA